MSKKYDGLAMLVSVLWWIGGLCIVVGAALHSAELAVGLPVVFGGLGLIFGNVQLYLFVEIARDVHEIAGKWDRQQNRFKVVKNRMKITKEAK